MRKVLSSLVSSAVLASVLLLSGLVQAASTAECDRACLSHLMTD